jgi:NhaP-type Na+/H+ or K+/H+ antiporter
VTLLAVFVALIFLYGLFSARLERTVLTAPILFTTAGMVVFLVFPALPERGKGIEVFLRLAEAGLVLLLFTDASRTDLKVLRSIRALPVRLLSTGLLLTLLLGTLVALVLFRQLSVFEAGILGAILAPPTPVLGR